MSEQVKLEKSLSPLQVCALALGSIVGWGCFVLPGDMFLPRPVLWVPCLVSLSAPA